MVTDSTNTGLSMKMRRQIPLLALFLSIGIPAWGHHSFSAVFDEDSPIEITGTVTEVDWRNPHAWIYIDVESGNGEIVNWAVELGSTNGLTRRGWSRNTVRIGEVISVSGYRARDGSTRGSVRSIALADGREMTGNSSRP